MSSLLGARFAIYSQNVDWYVFTFVVLFTIGSWIDLNGVWCELPLMTYELPEGWTLASVIVAATQVAQIGPLLFLISKCLCPNKVSYVLIIYIILGIGALSCLLLSFFWKSTVFIGGQQRSLGLYVLTFTLGLLDGTSSVTFMPFIGTYFKQEYIIPIYIGESLSAMIPSVLGLVQGVGKDPGCKNVTNDKNEFELEPLPLRPNYSVSVYYIFLFVLLVISTIGFTLLNCTKVGKKGRKLRNEVEDGQMQSQQEQQKDKMIIESLDRRQKPSKNEEWILLGVIFLLSFLGYGVLPSLQSYSALPYGNNTFHLAVNLSFVFLPFTIFLSIWSYKITQRQILIESFVAIIFSIYIIIVSTMSPCPPLLHSWFGSVLMVFSWVLTSCLFMRIRCCVAARLEESGQRVLLLLGGFTMFGQMIGGILMFLIVTVYELFTDLPSCTTALSYCIPK